MVILSPWLTFWVLLPVPFILTASIKTGKKLQSRYEALQKSITFIYDFLETCFTGVKLIKANAKEDAQGAFFSAKAEAQQAAEISSSKMDIIFSYFFHYADFFKTCILVKFNAWWIIISNSCYYSMESVLFSSSHQFLKK